MSPLEVARRKGHKEVVKLLEAAAAGLTFKHHLEQNLRFNSFRASLTSDVSGLICSIPHGFNPSNQVVGLRVSASMT